MKLSCEVKSIDSEETLRNRVVKFMNAAGYRKQEGAGELSFERGSRIGSLTAFTPKGWCVHSSVEIHPDPSGDGNTATIKLDVDTSGQIVTAKERAFWQEELEDFKDAVLTGSFNLEDGPYSANAALLQNIGLTFAAVLLGMAGIFTLLWFILNIVVMNTE